MKQFRLHQNFTVDNIKIANIADNPLIEDSEKRNLKGFPHTFFFLGIVIYVYYHRNHSLLLQRLNLFE